MHTIANRNLDGSVPHNDSPKPPVPINILLVDDEPKNLTVLETVLDSPDYRLVRASSADQALLALVADEFALLILDISMPGMTGFELAQMIKERKKTAHVPIIFLTAYYNEDEHVLEGYGTGAVDYLRKPVNPAILRSKVSVFVDLYRNKQFLLAEVNRRLRVEEQLREVNTTLEQRILQRTQELREHQARLHQAADAARLTYFELDFLAGTARIGPNFAAVMGFRVRPAEHFSIAELTRALLDHVVHDDRARMQLALEQLVRGLPGSKIEYRIVGDDWIERWIESEWAVEHDPEGHPSKTFGTNLEITLHKRTEAHLRRANADLEQFAFSASHDLREPLRNIAIYCQLFQKYYGQNLDQRAESFLGYMVEGAERMGLLLSDLLKYTQAVVLDQEPAASVEVEKVLQGVLASLQRIIGESGAKITYAALPVVLVHEVHLHQLLQNTIENAIKYRKEENSPEVHISATRQESTWELSVRDNGIGIAPEFHSQVFGIFKRLHAKGGKYSGTGVGLAICQKIVERYGGKMWIESARDLGATFHFTLPAAGDSVG